MTQEEAEAAVIDVIVEIQEMSGRETCDIDARTKPIDDVPEFDSLNAFEATATVAKRMGLDIPCEESLFKAGSQARTVWEIAGRLMEIAGSSKGVAHGK